MHSRPATLDDLSVLAPRLRAEDKREIRAVSGRTPEAALFHGLEISEVCEVIEAGGELVGVYGVVRSPQEPILGAIWMLCTDGLERHQIAFLRRCRAVIDELNKQYPLLCNVVDARNTIHIKWLRWCGFTFIKLHENYGMERRPFYEFVRI